MTIPPLKFTEADARAASDSWMFNCGPAALCAMLSMTPDELRPHLLDFESKGYTNPTLMFNVLKRLGVKHRLAYRSDTPGRIPAVDRGLMRVQWGGPWTKPGVPMRARYRMTHWVGVSNSGADIFDVNALSVGGWIKVYSWEESLVPWLLNACVPKHDGTFWPTHCIELT